MKKLLTIAALTILTSTAWANNSESHSNTGEGSLLNIKHSQVIHRANNTEGDSYTGEGAFISIDSSDKAKRAHNELDGQQAAIHKHLVITEQQGR